MAKGTSCAVPCRGIYWRVVRPVHVLYWSSWRWRRLSFSWIWDNEGHPSQCVVTLEFDFVGLLGRKTKAHSNILSAFSSCHQPPLTSPLALAHLGDPESTSGPTCLSSSLSFFQKDIAPFFSPLSFRLWECDDRDCYRFEREEEETIVGLFRVALLLGMGRENIQVQTNDTIKYK